MKRKILFLILLIFSVNLEAQVSNKILIGKWKLKEVLSDPGDGSGEFIPIKSEKLIEFNSDGAIRSNGSLCGPFHQIGNKSEGTYSKEDKRIYPVGCSKATKLNYELKNGCLIIHYFCKEGCAEKYEKVK